MFMRFLHLHARFFLALALSAGAYALLPQLAASHRLAVGWDAGVAAWLALHAHMMANPDDAKMRARAKAQDVSGKMIFIVLVAAAFVSLYGILGILSDAKLQQGALQAMGLGLAVATIVLSWLFIHTLFAVHYAHLYYARGDGLIFPQEHTSGEPPDYWDFVYFALVLGMTFQVSDVQIACRPMRRFALAHAVIAFFFNTFILALAVNIAASMM